MAVFTNGSQVGGTLYKEDDASVPIRNFDLTMTFIHKQYRMDERDYTPENIEEMVKILIRLTGGI